MVAVPDLMSAYQQGAIDLEAVKAIQLGMIAHCELMGDRVAILDPPPGLNAQQIKEWRVDQAGYDSKYAALYYPWIKVFDPATGRRTVRAAERARRRHLGPQRRHPRRAQGARQRGDPRRRARDPESPRRRARPAQPDRHQLHPGLPRRRDPRLGRADAVQRPGLALPQRPPAVQLPRGVDPQRHPVGGVRAQRRRAVGPRPAHDRRFLVNQWRKGALFGPTPDEAFFVKCDRETNPPRASTPARSSARSASRR